MTWLSDNIWTIVIALAVLALVVLDLRFLIKQKKRGEHSCSACSLAGSCPIHAKGQACAKKA
ncbi:MAG: FeoB-associated Cys-rich membrane protein [Erysipelotrichales bacterium]|nr:FeoB-associated Cys-rich membrane protein [Erysipelotrichales bacterium]